MKFSSKIDTYVNLPGVTFWNQWYPVLYFKDQKK